MVETKTSFYYPGEPATINLTEGIPVLNVKKLTENAIIPTLGSKDAAGFDLYANNDEEIVIRAFSTEMIGTGIAAAIPEGYVGLLFARSGLATKRSLRPANCVGVIDADYRGEIKVALHNDGNVAQSIAPHERIAQLSLIPYLRTQIIEVPELNETERGSGGFGSTGRT